MNLTHAARRIHAARFFALLGLALLLGALPRPDYARQLTDADYARAAKFLLRSTDPLVGRNYDPLVDHEVQRVHWLDATHFWYRDHDASGDHFFEVDARTGRRAPRSTNRSWPPHWASPRASRWTRSTGRMPSISGGCPMDDSLSPSQASTTAATCPARAAARRRKPV